MENITHTQNIRFFLIMAIVAAALMVPLVAMRFTAEVNWNVFDFMVAGVLLASTGIVIEVALRTITNVWYRIAACALILFVLFLVWAELAVGVFGTRFAGS